MWDGPGEDIERLPNVGVAVPAEHQEEIAERRERNGGDDERFVAAGSESVSLIFFLDYPDGTHLLMSTPEMTPPSAFPTTAGTRCAPDTVLELLWVI